MALSIEVESPTKSDIKDLLQSHFNLMHSVSPPESCHVLNIDGLCTPGITLWAAREHQRLLGCGALQRLSDSAGELKSMHTLAEARGRGVAKRLLVVIESEARLRGYQTLSLETGSMEQFLPALRFYAGQGYEVCPPFADYCEDPNSVFMRKTL